MQQWYHRVHAPQERQHPSASVRLAHYAPRPTSLRFLRRPSIRVIAARARAAKSALRWVTASSFARSACTSEKRCTKASSATFSERIRLRPPPPTENGRADGCCCCCGGGDTSGPAGSAEGLRACPGAGGGVWVGLGPDERRRERDPVSAGTTCAEAALPGWGVGEGAVGSGVSGEGACSAADTCELGG